jgi:predicted aspartyl protease
MSPFRLPGLFVLLGLLAGCAAKGGDFDFDTCGVRPRAVIPIEMRGDIPLMHATIKGKPATLVLDTGAVGVALTEQAMERFGLRRDGNAVMVGGGVGGTSRNFAGRMEEFRIGDLPVPDHRVSVLPAASGIARSGLVDGLFGVSVLSVFEVELDMPHGVVTLYGGKLCRDTTAPPWAAGAEVVAAEQSELGRFLVPVELDGRKLTALLDTGASVTVLSTDVANALGVTQAMLEAGPRRSLAGTGPAIAAAWVHRFGRLRFANQDYVGPWLIVSARAAPKVDMIIGADYLAHRRIWLSYARKLVFIDRPAGP